METRLLIIIGIVIISAIIFGVLIIIDSGLRPFKEHYQIEITGLKETYLVGEPYSFSNCGSFMVNNDSSNYAKIICKSVG